MVAFAENEIFAGGSGYNAGAETQNYYVRNRYYLPTLGRWLTRDPIGYQGGINLYAYVQSSPVGKADASGLASPPQLVLGKKIHDKITDNYELATQAHGFYDTALVTIVRDLHGHVAGLPPGTRLKRPDIFDKVSRRLCEIKSAKTGDTAAHSKAQRYVGYLRDACVRARLGSRFGPGTSGAATVNGSVYKWTTSFFYPGVIIYWKSGYFRRQILDEMDNGFIPSQEGGFPAEGTAPASGEGTDGESIYGIGAGWGDGGTDSGSGGGTAPWGGETDEVDPSYEYEAEVGGW